MVRDGATEVTSSQRLTVTLEAGEAQTIEIGRGGRPVIGKLVLPPDFQQAIVWGQVRLELESDVPEPFPVGLDQNDPQAFAKWQQTKEARDYEVAVAAWQAQMAGLPEFSASVDRDGTFRIDNVPAGKFILREWLGLGNGGLSMTPRSFEVPEIDGDYGESPLDLGEIELAVQ